MDQAIQNLYTEQVLMTETVEALQSLYQQKLGTKPHHKMGKDRLVVEILNATAVEQQPSAQPKPAPKVEPKRVTLEQLMEALEPFAQRGLDISLAGDTWTLKNGPAIDSGHVTVPIELIKISAEALMRARFPAKIGQRGQEMLV
jgi:hypothetical protein